MFWNIFASRNGTETEVIPDLLSQRAIEAYERYTQTRSSEDISEAISCANQGIDLANNDSLLLAHWSNYLGVLLANRYEQVGAKIDLEDAIRATRNAIHLTPMNHPDLASRLTNLSYQLGSQYEVMGLEEDLEKAIQTARQAVQLTPSDHPDLAGRLSNLVLFLGMRCDWEIDMKYLEQAIEMARQGVQSTPGDHPYLAVSLNNLGNKLEERQQWLGDDRADKISDMATSIRKQVLKAMKHTVGDMHPYTIIAMNNLTITLGNRGKLDEAASMRREMLERLQQIFGDEAVKNLTIDDPDILHRAASMRISVLKNRQKALGHENIHTTRSAERLRNFRFAFSIVQLLQYGVATQKRTPAENHPSRLAIQHKLVGGYEVDRRGYVTIKYNRSKHNKWNLPRSRIAAAYVQTEFAGTSKISSPFNPPTSGVSLDVRQLFDRVEFSSLFNDGVRIVRFIHGKPGAQETFLNRLRIGLEQRIGQRIDWSPFPPVTRSCLPNESKVVWNWGGKELSVILSREEACQYYATCRPVLRSSNNQILPFTNFDYNPDVKATPSLGTRTIHNLREAAGPTIQTYLTTGLAKPQNSQEKAIYWCIDRIFDEPVKTVFRCIERAEQIRDDSRFYQQVNHKLRSAGGTGLKGWITPYISWKRVTAVEFIKFLRVRDDWVIRDKAELPQSDEYEHNVGTPESARMMILAEEMIAGLHNPKGAEGGNYMVNTLPKRRCPPALPVARGTEAWGIHAKMGFSAGRIIWWFTSSIIFLVAFATVWLATVDKTDVQTALMPGTAIVAVLTLMLGIFQTLNQ